MTNWRQIFDFRRAPYLRPNETWTCGRAAQGAPCRLGPGALGRCRTRTECDPIFSQGAWVCTRAAELGGKCEEGPSANGVCCRAIPKCIPVRNLRSLRGRVTFWVFAATLLTLVAALGTDLRLQLFDPGPVIQAHSGVADCRSCHAVDVTRVRNWLHAAWAPTDTAVTSGKCLNCHDRGRYALRPHSMSKAWLTAISEVIDAPSGGFGDISTHIANGTVFPAHESTGESLACATCHKDHKGLHFNPNIVSNGRCQTCHKLKFAALNDGHPPFGDYPYVRRSRLAFDHNKHFKQHFDQSKVKSPPTKCADCHEPDPTGRYMVVMPFERTCGRCHAKDIEGTGLAGAKGVPVFSVPGLDAETLRKRGYGVGQWPEDADGDGLSPFVKALLAADAGLDKDLRRLADVDLQDLSSAGKPVLAAAQRVAWGYKRLLYDLGRHGGEAVQVRLANGFGFALDREAVGRLIGQIPREVIRAAEARWFPRLKREVTRHRNRRAGLNSGNPASHAAHAGAGDDALRHAAPVRLALAVPGDARILIGLGLDSWLTAAVRPPIRGAADHRRAARGLQLAQAGDLLNGNSKLIDRSALRLKEYRDLKREDKGANNSIFKKGGSSRSSAKTRAKRTVTRKKPVAKKPEKTKKAARKRAPVKKATVAKKPERKRAAKKRTGTGAKPEAQQPERRQADGAKQSGSAQRAIAGSAAKPRRDLPRRKARPAEPGEAAVVVRRPKVRKKLGPAPDAEQWARSGGWYRVDFTLYYRPAAHKDAFMKSWLNIAAATHGGYAEPYGKALLAVFKSPDTVGKCVRCHSVDRVAGGRLVVNWKPFTPNPDRQKFTIFDHATHFSIAGERGCQSCHQLNPKARFAIAYRGLDPTSFESNFFAPIKRETCGECHVPDSAGNACIQCHRYHVGEFDSAPIVTEIAGRPAMPARAMSRRPAPKRTRSDRVARANPSASAEPRAVADLPAVDVTQFPIPKPKPAVAARNATRKVAKRGGSYAVRLGSYQTKKRARSSMRRLKRSVGSYLGRRRLSIETARVRRGRVIYHVVARPFGKKAAQKACRTVAAKRKIHCKVTR